MGYPLSQTLFTSVHIDRLLWPEPKILGDANFIRGRSNELFTLSHKILRAYCLLLIKACDLVLAMVTSQHYYEVRRSFLSAGPVDSLPTGRRFYHSIVQP